MSHTAFSVTAVEFLIPQECQAEFLVGGARSNDRVGSEHDATTSR